MTELVVLLVGKCNVLVECGEILRAKGHRIKAVIGSDVIGRSWAKAIDPEQVGRELLTHLVDAACRAGFRTLVSLVYEKNVVSIAGCLLYGFRPMATLHKVAILGSVRENVIWIQRKPLVDDPLAYRRLMERLIHMGLCRSSIDPRQPVLGLKKQACTANC
jgi:hypothetical protein